MHRFTGGIDTFLGLVLNLAEIILGFVNEITHVFRDGILGFAQIICGVVECILGFLLERAALLNGRQGLRNCPPCLLGNIGTQHVGGIRIVYVRRRALKHM